MKASGSPIEALCLAIVVIGVLAGAGWILLAAPLVSGYKYGSDALQLTRHQIAQLARASLSTSSRVPEVAPEHIERAKPNFLVGADDSNAIANLQTKLRSLVLENGSELVSARPLAAKSVDSVKYLGLEISIAGEMKDIHRILTRIEYGHPILFVERVRLRLDAGRGSQQAVSSIGAARMRADLNIWGAMWSELPRL